MAATIVVS